MKRLLVTLKYRGTNYVGWQVQQNGTSVQTAVQDAIEKLYGTRVDVTGCSRTDSGVHANGYRFCFTPPCETTPFKVIASLNHVLPDDMGVCDCIEVDEEFHPRYSAVAKEYVYKLYGGRARDPFLNGLAWHYRGEPDVELMNSAAKHFIGKYDFCSFMAKGSKIIDTTRTVFDCRAEQKKGYVQISICGDGFLYKMVRIIVGTLIAVSEGKFTPSDIDKIIAAKSRDAAGRTAPSEGLYLNRVFYDLKEVSEHVGKQL